MVSALLSLQRKIQAAGGTSSARNCKPIPDPVDSCVALSAISRIEESPPLVIGLECHVTPFFTVLVIDIIASVPRYMAVWVGHIEPVAVSFGCHCCLQQNDRREQRCDQHSHGSSTPSLYSLFDDYAVGGECHGTLLPRHRHCQFGS
jgi:hypothetical protein